MMHVLNVNSKDYQKLISDLSRKQVSFMARTSGAFNKDPLIDYIRQAGVAPIVRQKRSKPVLPHRS